MHLPESDISNMPPKRSPELGTNLHDGDCNGRPTCFTAIEPQLDIMRSHMREAMCKHACIVGSCRDKSRH